MLFDYIRVLTSIGTLTDYSIANQDSVSKVSLDLTTTDYLYIAQKMPFNNVFFYMDGVNNTNPSNLIVQYWNGIEWINAVDVLDGTMSDGKTLHKSGNLQFSLDNKHSWQRISDTNETYAPAELQSLHIYECYWIRIKPSADISAGAKAKEIGYAFTSSAELVNFDIEVNTYLEGFGAGKGDWIPEILTASKLLVLELRKKGLIVHQGQIIQIDDVHVACSYRTLELIYAQLGPSYREKLQDTHVSFQNSLSLERFTFDSDGNGQISLAEQTNVVRKLTR